jgi:hypothetical protein
MYGRHNRVKYVKDIAEALHRIQNELEMFSHDEDPYYTQKVDASGKPIGCRSYPETREEIKTYIKTVLANDIIDKMFDDDFLNEDDPEYINNQAKKKYLAKGFDDEISELLVDIEEEDINLDGAELEDLIKDLETPEQYVIIFDDSDGERRWYETTSSMEVLKHICKTRHRKSIGCNCNEYVDSIYQNGKNTNLHADDLK